MENVDDIDLEERIAGANVLMPTTEASYAQFLRQFCEFANSAAYEKGIPIEAKYLTDDNLAKFVFWMGDRHSHKPHILKGLSAAIGFAIQQAGLPNMYAFKHEYRKFHVAVQVWSFNLF